MIPLTDMRVRGFKRARSYLANIEDLRIEKAIGK